MSVDALSFYPGHELLSGDADSPPDLDSGQAAAVDELVAAIPADAQELSGLRNREQEWLGRHDQAPYLSQHSPGLRVPGKSAKNVLHTHPGILNRCKGLRMPNSLSLSLSVRVKGANICSPPRAHTRESCGSRRGTLNRVGLMSWRP